MDKISNYRMVRVLLYPAATRTTVSIVARERRGGAGVDRLLLRPGSVWIDGTNVDTGPAVLRRCAEALTAMADALER